MEYNLAADLLNKFSQLSPPVQIVLVCFAALALVGGGWFLKEAVALLAQPCLRHCDACGAVLRFTSRD